MVEKLLMTNVPLDLGIHCMDQILPDATMDVYTPHSDLTPNPNDTEALQVYHTTLNPNPFNTNISCTFIASALATMEVEEDI